MLSRMNDFGGVGFCNGMGFEEAAVEMEIYQDHLDGLQNHHGAYDGDPERKYDEMRSRIRDISFTY